MSEKVHNKLVRDKIPEILGAAGARGEFRHLSEEEYRRALLDKLIEEATELRDSDGDLSERADVAEVIRAIDETFGFDEETVERERDEKFRARGGFTGRLFLVKTTEKP